MEKVLYLIRGLPGAGKSTLGLHLVDRICLHSADDFFMVEQAKGAPKYVFDGNRLPEAHLACQNAVRKDMVERLQPRIAVANTFTKKEYMQPYYDLAKKYGYTVMEIIVKSDFKNIHGVPQATIDKMRAEFEV